VGLLVPALWPLYRKPPPRETVACYLALGAALIFPAWWYAVHVPAILALRDGPQIFAVGKFAPFAKLAEVGLAGGVALIWRQLNQWQFPIFTGLLWVPVVLATDRRLFLGLIAMLLGAIALDGAHIWEHAYYFFGASLMSLILIGRALARLARFESRAVRVWVRGFCVFSLVWGLAYGIRNNVWVTARTQDWWTLAAPIREALPGAGHLVTDDVTLTPTKLLLMGRTGTIGTGRLADICRMPGYRDISPNLVYVIDRETYDREKLQDRSCLALGVLLQSARTEFGEWVLIQR
jgi:hypothetical protein